MQGSNDGESGTAATKSAARLEYLQSKPTYSILPVKHLVQSQLVSEGEGVLVHRAFPTRQIDYFDPFLLLDEMGPTNFKPNTARGFPPHPHKGFETVTYMLEGAMRHRDSEGNEGLLGPGDVQWMTAGRGIVHSEMPDPDFVRRGGLMHGFQLWVNLPRKDKLVAPRYQDLPAARVAEAVSEDGSVKIKIIAGEALGVVAPIETHTEMMYLHFSLKPGASFVQPVPADFNVLAYVMGGEAQIGKETMPAGRLESQLHSRLSPDEDGQDLTADGLKRARAGQIIIFDKVDLPPSEVASADHRKIQTAVAFAAPFHEGLELLLLAGRPIGEPVARYGPFVMNTREEIEEALEQYHNGQLGKLR